MSVKGRINAIRIIEKVKDYPEYAHEIGLSVDIRKMDKETIREILTKEKRHEKEYLWRIN